MMEREYTIIVRLSAEGGYWTDVPALPGCGAQGATIEEAIEMTKDAIQLYLASLMEDGLPIPEDTSIPYKVKVTLAA